MCFPRRADGCLDGEPSDVVKGGALSYLYRGREGGAECQTPVSLPE